MQAEIVIAMSEFVSKGAHRAKGGLPSHQDPALVGANSHAESAVSLSGGGLSVDPVLPERAVGKFTHAL